MSLSHDTVLEIMSLADGELGTAISQEDDLPAAIARLLAARRSRGGRQLF